MKELEHKHKLGQVITKETKKKQTLQFWKTIKPHRNHTLWQINKTTLEITKAVFNLNTTYKLNWRWKKGDKPLGYGALITETNCEYVSALDKKNALKKFKEGNDGNKFNKREYLKL